MTNSKWDMIVSRIGNVHTCGEFYGAHCPAHSDGTASMGLGVGDDGWIWFKCHATCDTDEILRALGLTHKDLAPDHPTGKKYIPKAKQPVKKSESKTGYRSIEEVTEIATNAAIGSEAKIRELAIDLGVPEESIQALGVGWVEGSTEPGTHPNFWTFPERDPHGNIIGINCRIPGLKKKLQYPRTPRGLSYIPSQFDPNDKLPILNVEGGSDVCAAHAIGQRAVGRPGAESKYDLVAEFLAPKLSDGVTVYCLGENDEKPDGKWPGKTGAWKCAEYIAANTSYSVYVAQTPQGKLNKLPKDLREIVRESGGDKLEIGTKLIKILEETAQRVDCPGKESIPEEKPLNHSDEIRDTPEIVAIPTESVNNHNLSCRCHGCRESDKKALKDSLRIWDLENMRCHHPKHLYGPLADKTGTVAFKVGCRKRIECDGCLNYHRQLKFDGYVMNIIRDKAAGKTFHKLEIDRSRGDAVRKDIQRKKLDRYRIAVVGDKYFFIANGHFLHSEPSLDPVQDLRDSIDRSDRSSSHTVTASRGWPMAVKPKKEKVLGQCKPLPGKLTTEKFILLHSRNLGVVPEFGILKGDYLEKSAKLKNPVGWTEQQLKNALNHSLAGKEMTENRPLTIDELWENVEAA